MHDRFAQPGGMRQVGAPVLGEVDEAGGQPCQVPGEGPAADGHQSSSSSAYGSSGALAGPLRTTPVRASKREPWQGQSQDFSSPLQRTTQPMWVQRALWACSDPSPARYTA